MQFHFPLRAPSTVRDSSDTLLPMTESMGKLANIRKSICTFSAGCCIRSGPRPGGGALLCPGWCVHYKRSGHACTGNPTPTGATSSSPAITFTEALQRARVNNPQMQAALTAAGLAHEDLVQSRAALLPNLTYNMSAIYTQPTPGPTPAHNSPIFIANNGVHEYVAQGNVHQNLSLQSFADYGRASAAQAVARAKSEIALRGLAVTVAQAFYGYLAATHKYETAQRANEEAQRFLGISQKLEQGGEVAHSDVIKAQLQAQQQQRDLREAELAKNRTRLDLAVLLFRDFNENFTAADDLTSLDPLPSFE